MAGNMPPLVRVVEGLTASDVGRNKATVAVIGAEAVGKAGTPFNTCENSGA